jgi:hypothetical protein
MVSCCHEKLVAAAGDSLGAQRKGMSAIGSCYQTVASEDMTVGHYVCACVYACAKEPNKSDHQSKTHL